MPRRRGAIAVAVIALVAVAGALLLEFDATGLGRAVREHFGGVLRQRATHLPVALITLLGAGWLWASLSPMT